MTRRFLPAGAHVLPPPEPKDDGVHVTWLSTAGPSFLCRERKTMMKSWQLECIKHNRKMSLPMGSLAHSHAGTLFLPIVVVVVVFHFSSVTAGISYVQKKYERKENSLQCSFTQRFNGCRLSRNSRLLWPVSATPVTRQPPTTSFTWAVEFS